LSLLFGRFEYTERGILDRTHLRFFTYKTVTRMLVETGLHLNVIHATPIPLELISPFFEKSPVGRAVYGLLGLLTNLFPTLFGYQFVIESSKE
jgi:hypothetical protein